MWLLDVYRHQNKLILWIKGKTNIRKEISFRATIYAEDVSEIQPLVQSFWNSVLKPGIFETKQVWEIPVRVDAFEKIVEWIERETRYRVKLYNADVKPEQQFMYEQNLYPGCKIRESTDSLHISSCTISLEQDCIYYNNKQLELRAFVQQFLKDDPDFIYAYRAFYVIPKIEELCKKRGIPFSFHRWDIIPNTYRGGKSFYTYGSVLYKEFPVRLHGRILIDTASALGHSCTPDALLELAELSKMGLQQIASRSHGYVFQSALVRTMYKRGFLVPYKEKPIDTPLTLQELVHYDRAGLTLDPILGFHTTVAEFDFCSMFPWIMYNQNCAPEPVGESLKPFIDRRMHYKKNPSKENTLRSKGLKGVLVSSYGYLRFREFKLGLPTSHMKLCYYAREILLDAKQKAEAHGYVVVHGIVDSLYIKDAPASFGLLLEDTYKIPLTYEGTFKWIVFLPSNTDADRPVPTKYFGVYESGEIKMRGIEARQDGQPALIKRVQKELLIKMSKYNSFEEIGLYVHDYLRIVKKAAKEITLEDAIISVRVGKDTYSANTAQKKVVAYLATKGISVKPGERIIFVYSTSGACHPERCKELDIQKYIELLVQAAHVVLQYWCSEKEIWQYLEGQKTLACYKPYIFLRKK